MNEQKPLSEMSVIELKAMLLDQIDIMEQVRVNIMTLRNELKTRTTKEGKQNG